MSNGVFNLNFLALLLSDILGGPKFTLGGHTPPGLPLAENFFLPKASTSQYIIVNFQLRSSMNAELTERSLYNRFCIEKSAKIGFLWDFGDRLRYLVGTP